MDRREFIQTGTLASLGVALGPFSMVSCTNTETGVLFKSFITPPQESLAGVYWWWLNGLVNKEGISRDLREFKEKGINDLLLVNSAGSNMPVGVKFLSDEWKELFRYALTEARKYGIEIGVNMCSGWCMGGPWITPEMSGRWFLQSELMVEGPLPFAGKLPLPGNRSGYDHVFNPPGYKEYIDLPLDELDYRDTAVVAFRLPDEKHSRLDDERKKHLPAKTNRRDASNHTPAEKIMAPTLVPLQVLPDDQPVNVDEVVDLTGKMDASGALEWDVPEGRWVIVRTGHRMTGSRLSIAQPEADGLSVAWLNSVGVDKQFEMLGKVILEEAEKAGYQLKFFCDDSFEDGFPNWTADILDQFRYYRGYDATPYLPVFSGYIVGSAEISDRFLHDYRKTVADCMADKHYKRFAELCHEHGLQVQNESAGPSRSGTMCMDTLKNLGRSDLPAGEFWLGIKHDQEGGLKLPYGESRLERNQNKVTKMVASAAHIYGKNLVTTESYTTYRHWMDSPATLKQSTDRAFCEGVNRILVHTSTATRPEDGKPGYEYYAGTHFNPNITWWDQSGGFLSYIGRCQHLLRQGNFVADVLYYNGDWAPNIVEPKHVDPSLGKGYDYDVCNEEVLLNYMSVKDGLITLQSGMKYRVLVLPDSEAMPENVMGKIASFVAEGATVIGKPPIKDPGLKNYPACDNNVKELATRVWGNCDGVNQMTHQYGKGRVFFGKEIRSILQDDNIYPDFETNLPVIDFIHRSAKDNEIYFIANLDRNLQKADCLFRISGRQPEIWDPVTGKRRIVSEFIRKDGRTLIPMKFEGFQSFFIIFPRNSDIKRQKKSKDFPQYATVSVLDGPWTVKFDPNWGGPESVRFEELSDWSRHEDERIRYYSGKATYRKNFDVPAGKQHQLFLDLGKVKDIAEIRINGKNMGVIWTHPWRVEITDAVKSSDNVLEIDIVNLWPNRLIGDMQLPEEKRYTKTNISLKPGSPLLTSGLLGPVRLLNIS
ncbi:MAG: glycosyl hydrolase [Bacteroidales bacterium]|jgi:hypothetical protein|nr:glycosyl hydrolase [Bacteroidales bacterium]